MASFGQLNTILSPTVLILFITLPLSKAVLDAHFYDQKCPQAEHIISETLRNASIYDPKVPAHDSKAKLKMACPNIVSCADIIAIAARDAVTMSGGPYWNVLKGRKDGRVSKANETINLPAPSFNVTQLSQSFARRGLGLKDLVALSGGHTLGFSHCSSFEARVRNFSALHEGDPNINIEFAEKLRKKCLEPKRDHKAGEFLDSTSSTFDNDYYQRLMAGKGVFGSDQALYGDFRTRWIVETFAKDEKLFFREFAASMVKLGNVGVIEDGGVRVKCRVVN
ncbi:hypothetical protein RJ639_006516 [Escallonia herrerae]|uniref:Plant heme peroxidase family profile domain-containing protein n=1 Tax=Escallonia herrerae TaxID=1293975 RepID=A0AA88VWS8_9ASTE|nr:hypothetical protein RJ639_006516 [Escallonia herrerae]